jgi:probable rRNA maturation factor
MSRIRLSGPPRGRRVPLPERRRLVRRARRVLAELGARDAELSLVLAADPEMAELNARFRGRARPTDVLSFSLLEGEGREHRGALLGDVVIGVEVAARQARRARRSLDDEAARLLIHGVLHLLGWDHEREDEARAMRAQERRLWRDLAR